MLEHQKTVLKKVSYNPGLFRKELEKSIKWLTKEELLALYSWLLINYGSNYMEMIANVFNNM